MKRGINSGILNTAKSGTFTCDFCRKLVQVKPGTCPEGWLIGIFDPSVHCSHACLEATTRAGRG